MSNPVNHVARAVRPAGQWSGAPLDSATLDYEERFRRRIVLTCDGGTRVLLDLADAQLLNDGDALVSEAGALIAVRAKPEALLEVRGASPRHLLRLAWHLGNRHLPTEIHGDRLLVRDDHVIADMLMKQGAEVRALVAPFNPEGGAYGPGRTHGH
ncbi:MAG: urease accessory protein UreE [Kiloniellales bacterium]|nr:urease accessory protein UreE [Kiloniellales bacterium]